MRKYLLVLSAICFAATSFSQDFSNKGKDFYLCFPQHVPSGNNLATLSIYITSDRASTGTITTANGTFSATFSISAANNFIQEIQIPHGAGVYITNAESGTIIQKSIRIKVDAGKPAVVAYAQQWGAARSAATLLLPVNVLGKKYYSINYTQNGTDQGTDIAKSQFQIIATKNNTVVEITPRLNGVLGSTITVNFPLAGDLYQYQADEDLTGTLIKSVASGSGGCLPIAVFSGSSALTMGTNVCAGGGQTSFDPLWQQAYPVSTWGKNFGFIPFQDYPIGNPYRVLASEDNTTVSVDGAVVAVLNAGEIYPGTFTSAPGVTANPVSITADKPICVAEYSQRQNCSGATPASVGDPDMVILNPIEQNIKDITVFSSTQQAITHQWVNVLLQTVAIPSFTINGAPPTGTWQPFPTLPGYSYLRESLQGISFARIKADSGFNAIAYGFGNFESYAYSAGTNVIDLYQHVGVTSQYGIEPSPSVCTGSPFKFKISLPYLADSIYWDLSLLPTAPPNVMMHYSHPPVASDADSTTFVNGKQIYWYSLPVYYTFNTIGIFPVNISAFTANTEGCGNQQDIPFDLDISDPPVADFSWVSNGCVNQAVQFTDITESAKPLYHWWWSFGDPGSGANNISNLQNPIHQFSAPGTYTVRFCNITTPGCLSDTLSKQITVTNIPAANFTFSSPLCAGRPVTITDASSASAPGVLAKWYWDLGDGNPAFIALNGNAQVANYTPWGPRTVTLKVETNSGCQSLVTSHSTTINAVPVPSFTHLQACLPYQSVSFTNTSTVADGTAMTHHWDFGDPGSLGNNTSNVTSPSHLYTATGTYPVILTATNAGGCATSTTVNITDIYAQAHGSFTVNAENCLNDPTVFTSTSTGSGAAIATYYWDFGDASPISNIQSPSHTYATAGIKTIKHWVKTINGCMSDTAQHTVTVNPLPTGNFNFSAPLCQTRTISFTDASVANAGNLASWSWNFDDLSSGVLNTSALQNPTHEFAAEGVYNVKLTVTTNKGCVSAVFIKQVTINARPQAGYIVPEVCLNDTYAQFLDTTHIADGTITSWQWNFGDAALSTGTNPNTSTLQNPTHSYTATGLYDAQLIVTSALGCKDTILHTLTVSGSFPVANFTVNNAGSLCANDSVRIVNTSTVFPGVITKVEIYWDNVGQPAVFETDNTPPTGGVYAHLYPNFQSPLTKNFTIRLRAYSGGVCVNDRFQTITVNAAPKVQFNVIPNSCLNIAPFQITQASEVGAVPGTFVFTGPGVSSTGMFDPVSIGPGLYTIHYTYTSNMGCMDSATQQIRVLVAPVANFGYGNPACERNTLLFSDSSISTVGSIVKWTWDFGDATPVVIRNNNTSFNHTFAVAGIYHVKLFVTTSDGCLSLVRQKDVEVKPLPKPNFSFEDTTCLPNAVIHFQNLSTIADGTENQFSYLWNFGDPASGALNSSIAYEPVHQYMAVGPYDVRLKVTSGAHCIDSTIINLNTIHPQPKANFDFNKPSVCIGDDVILRDRSNGKDGTVTTWFWDFGDTDVSGLQNPSHTYSAIGNYNITFYVINSFGCNSDTVTRKYGVYPYPVVDAGPDKFVLEGEHVILQPTVTGNDLLYQWSPAQYLNNNQLKTPVCTPIDDITYTLSVTGEGGCVATDKVFVKVLKMPKIPNTFSPNNDFTNNTWVIQYLDKYPNCRVQVFTRTGQQVFESRGYKTPWDGTMNGKPLPVDTYYYIIEPESGRAPVTGYVTIVK